MIAFIEMNDAVAIGVLLAMYDMVCMGTEFSGALHLYVYRFLQLYIIFGLKKALQLMYFAACAT
jgi:hypothetical protein